MSKQNELKDYNKKELIEIILRKRKEMGIFALIVLALSIVGMFTIIDQVARLVA